MDIFKRFTEKSRQVIRLAREEADRFRHEYLGTEHLLYGLLKCPNAFVSKVIERMGVDCAQLRTELELNFPPGSDTMVMGDIPFTSRAKKVLEYALEEAKGMGQNYIGTEHLFLGILKEKNGEAAKVLNRAGIQYVATKETVYRIFSETMEEDEVKNSYPNLQEFGTDLTELAEEGRLDMVVGRNKEIERIIQIICRKTKNNPILIGEPGVGKTAIAEGLAQMIVSRDVPELLYDKRVVSLDIAGIIAGTKYRGQFEARVKAILRELKDANNIILFIDEIHMIIGAGSSESGVDASNMLKPALARGELQCVGATTMEEYRKYIEKHGALERRFQPIIVEEPSVDEAIEILQGLKEDYERHHDVIISDEAIQEAVMLSHRYMRERHLPDKAIDIIDEASARVRLKNFIFPPDIKKAERELAEVVNEKKALVNKQLYDEAVVLRRQEEALQKQVDEMKENWHHENDNADKRIVTVDDILYVISVMTSIPLSKIENEESEKLIRLEEKLKEKIIGQDEAIKAVSETIRRFRAGIKKLDKPMGSFLFVGPTGVGKTELAYCIAEALFGDRSALIRLDMTEYQEKFSSSKLLGAPPGYVGYEEGGQISDLVRRKPYSVVLLDEVEKAHPDIINLMLQVMDEGKLTDNNGRVVDFSNVLLIMTSNAGRKLYQEGKSMGFAVDAVSAEEEKSLKSSESELKKKKDALVKELSTSFSPEFINRIDDTILFKTLSRDDILAIIHIQLELFTEGLKEQNITAEVQEGVAEYLLELTYDPKSGARPVKRGIQSYIENKVSSELINGTIHQGDSIRLSLKNESLVIENTSVPCS